jgi:hypothetical protein
VGTYQTREQQGESMTRDDILHMAREAGTADLGINAAAPYVLAMFERFAALVATAEREACAQVCDERYNFEASRIAHIIRSRDAHAQNPV